MKDYFFPSYASSSGTWWAYANTKKSKVDFLMKKIVQITWDTCLILDIP